MDNLMKEIKFIVHDAEKGGFWAESTVHGIVTQGDDLDELREMIEDAISGYFFDSLEKPKMYTMVFETAIVASPE